MASQSEFYGAKFKVNVDNVDITGGTVSVTGPTTLTGNLTVTGNATIQGTTTPTGNIVVNSGKSIQFQTGSSLQLPSVDGIPTPLSITDSAIVASGTFAISGVYALASAVQVTIFRINSLNYLVLTPLIVTLQTCAASVDLIIAGAIPAGYRPASNVNQGTAYRISNNSTAEFGHVILGSNGTITVRRVNDAAFTAALGGLIDSYSCIYEGTA